MHRKQNNIAKKTTMNTTPAGYHRYIFKAYDDYGSISFTIMATNAAAAWYLADQFIGLKGCDMSVRLDRQIS